MAKNLIILLLLIITAAIGCRQSLCDRDCNFVLMPGDLLFQDLDCGRLCDAIEKVTEGYDQTNFSHVGIVTADDKNNFVVIEAVSSGVEVTPLQTFLERSSDANGYPKVVVGRLKKPYRHLIPSALREAFLLKGKPYDKVFAVNNEAYYCSELIYEIFRRANDNNPVFTLHPMTFRNPDTMETLPIWQEYFSELGVPVPEGSAGINPGSISRSETLKIIYAYGNPGKKAMSPK